jgi:hypothetical protein
MLGGGEETMGRVENGDIMHDSKMLAFVLWPIHICNCVNSMSVSHWNETEESSDLFLMPCAKKNLLVLFSS